ncbi:heparinase II/III family protein [Curvibacter sp. CHRR-16]|uniref:heparinase II/III domain-containing protein n=1 Tax=Curvibacter sp. CHRR-16 TaxID=2835872 RepID=UPI001BDA253B|nr:heparinase II/III family protein [Curvibacter sp. CHRR-16]MBT0568991.1 heparinase II/III family protein [Curvibacter sp. CHRR-16]
MQRRALLTALAALAALPPLGAQTATTNLPPHPRLLATDADWTGLQSRRQADPDLEALVQILLERARKDTKLPPRERVLEGKRLLTVSRDVLRRTLLWAFAWRITGDALFAERAKTEMLQAASFSDWNPSHYLDVAEMTTALAIGYDWLHSVLNPEERQTLRRAIVDKGIAQARNGHKTFSMLNNWGQVCISGMVLGALAVQEDEPQLCSDLLAAAQKKVHLALQAYAPDGVYPEGPSYWVYGTSYTVLLVAALRSCGFGGIDNWGLLQDPGLLRSTEFYAQSIGPTGKHFNFADSSDSQELAAPFVYLVRELQQPDWLQTKRTMVRSKQGASDRFAPLAALWWPTSQVTSSANTTPLQFVGQGPQPVAIWRSSWSDPQAWWFAIKGGGCAHNHAHMDAGGFVLEAMGVRWATDLGMQNYESLESKKVDLWNMKQGSPRWRIFRLGNDAHNTLMLDGQLHNATGMATLHTPSPEEAVLDLKPVFLPGQVQTASRTARFAARSVLLHDQLEGTSAGLPVRWAMTTQAQIEIQGDSALLHQNGQTMELRFSGNPVRLSVRDVANTGNPLDAANPNTRQLLASGNSDDQGQWQLQVAFTARS